MNLHNTLHGKQNAATAGRAQSFIVDRAEMVVVVGRGLAQGVSWSFYEGGQLNDAARDGPSRSGVLFRVQSERNAAAPPEAKQHGQCC